MSVYSRNTDLCMYYSQTHLTLLGECGDRTQGKAGAGLLRDPVQGTINNLLTPLYCRLTPINNLLTPDVHPTRVRPPGPIALCEINHRTSPPGMGAAGPGTLTLIGCLEV